MEQQTLFLSKTPEETGIHFSNTITSTPQLNILNYIYFYNGAGVASGDFNNDGLLDLYFTANQQADKLYLNTGGLKFDDITKAAQIDNTGNWTTGVTTVDINNDGLLDIYICKLGDYGKILGKNLLYINLGLDEKGIPKFKEDAKAYQLDFRGLSTQASFFDYDLDGDLDMFLLNHSTNPNQNYGKGTIRNLPDEKSGDKLFENIEGTFINVSKTAGILESKIGYGLGVAVSDLNNDGLPDIYVGNDFFENDYLYLNQGDKTFKEVITTQTHAIGHTTHFSMGNDIADINNDGYTDILSVDMLPENLKTYKTSGSEFNYQIYQNYLNNGYSRQFMQNSLQLNTGNESFSEIAYISGIAATEWSWSPLMADFDNDGWNDIYITNGILGATNDMDFINFISNEEIQRSLGLGVNEKDMAFIEKIPEKKTTNYFFKNNGNSTFTNTTKTWTNAPASFSNGAVYVDLDNDGDLDVVSNNVNQPAFILENTSQLTSSNHYLSFSFSGHKANVSGIGTKVILYADTLLISKENYPTRGYLSAVPPKLHFGLGQRKKIDSVYVIWPDQTFEVIRNLPTDTVLSINSKNAAGNYYKNFRKNTPQFLTEVAPLFTFQHKENTTIEFNKNPLLAFANSNEGPDVSVADINNDGLQDVFIGGGKRQSSKLFVQRADGGFYEQQPELFEVDALSEDVSHAFFDANGDSYLDLVVASGGNEFRSGKPIQPRLYLNDKGYYVKDSIALAEWAMNASRVKTFDFNDDQTQDIFILSNQQSKQHGHQNTQGVFKNIMQKEFRPYTSDTLQSFLEQSNCNDLVFVDLDGDLNNELITIGDWSPISVYTTKNGKFQLQKNNGLENTNGWWNTLKAADFDNDGDIDLVAGNWGLNSRLKASKKEPITMYVKDFDDNSNKETVLTYYYQGEETPLSSKDELVKQLPSLNKKYLSYANFANASIDQLFNKNQLEAAHQEKVFELASCYFENLGNGSFEKHQLPFEAQISSVNDIYVKDFNGDQFPDLLLVGNNFEISTQLSSLDASRGLLLLNDSHGNFVAAKHQKFDVKGAARAIEKLTYQGEDYLIITRNNDQPQFFKINK